MQFKRILMSCLIVILILCTVALSTGATEEVAPFELAVEVNSSAALSEDPFILQAGDTFTASITVNGNPSFSALELWLKYDTEALTLVKTESGAIDFTVGTVVPANELVVFEVEAGTIKVLNSNWEDVIKANGTIITFTFKVNENVHGSAAFEFVRTSFYSANFENKVKPSTITTETVNVHKFSADPVVEAATCVTTSKTTYTCETCKYEHVISGTELAAHTFGEWTTVTEPTCTEKGKEERACTVEGCTAEKETRETDSLGHDYSSEFVVDTEPTCVTPGSKSRPCSRCDDKTDITEIAVLGHDFVGEWVTEKNPTCTEKGNEKRTCQRADCTEAETREIDALGHKPVACKEVDPTKEAPGYTGGTYCSVCNVEITPRTKIDPIKDYTWIYILVAVVAVVAVGGGVCAYVFAKKKKANG